MAAASPPPVPVPLRCSPLSSPQLTAAGPSLSDAAASAVPGVFTQSLALLAKAQPHPSLSPSPSTPQPAQAEGANGRPSLPASPAPPPPPAAAGSSHAAAAAAVRALRRGSPLSSVGPSLPSASLLARTVSSASAVAVAPAPACGSSSSDSALLSALLALLRRAAAQSQATDGGADEGGDGDGDAGACGDGKLPPVSGEEALMDGFLMRHARCYAFPSAECAALFSALLNERLLSSTWLQSASRAQLLRVLRTLRVLTRDPSVWCAVRGERPCAALSSLLRTLVDEARDGEPPYCADCIVRGGLHRATHRSTARTGAAPPRLRSARAARAAAVQQRRGRAAGGGARAHRP